MCFIEVICKKETNVTKQKMKFFVYFVGGRRAIQQQINSLPEASASQIGWFQFVQQLLHFPSSCLQKPEEAAENDPNPWFPAFTWEDISELRVPNLKCPNSHSSSQSGVNRQRANLALLLAPACTLALSFFVILPFKLNKS